MRPAALRVLAQEKASYAPVEPPCPYFGTCGGCALQDLAYEDQLTLKRERLQRALSSLDHVPPLEIVGLEEPWRYRNKVELTFGAAHGALLLGYHAAGSFWRIVDIEDCLLVPEPVARVLREVRALAQATGLSAYQPKTHQGFFRYLLVRASRSTGQLLVCLMTTPGSREVMERLAQELAARHPEVGSLYWGITSRLADIAVPEELILLRGAATLDDQLGPFRLTLHPLSFLQPTSVQADRMYAHLVQTLGEGRGDVAWDLYCGLGLVSFYLSSRFRKVYGIDIEPRHLELAAQNAAANSLTNIEFRVGKVESLLLDRRFWLQEAKPELVVVDPPRVGLHPQALSSVLSARPQRIAYFSCNAQSLARDLAQLCESFPRYHLAAVKAFDMFPQTNHAEVLALLERG